MKTISLKSLAFLLILSCAASSVFASESGMTNKTIGANIYGSFQLADTLPVVDPGIGGGLYFDYRFNDRFSLMTEAFYTAHDGTARSNGEGNIQFIGLPVSTFKIYVLSNKYRLDPYIGLGIGFYILSEGSFKNSTGGMGMGAHIETGMDYALTDSFILGVGGTYRSVGILNNFSDTANATTYMTYMLFGRVGYRF